MSLVAAGLAEELLVSQLDSRALVGLAHSLAGILAIEGVSTQGAQIHVVSDGSGLDGLTAAVDAAAGAAHDLDEVVASLACTDVVQQLGNIVQTGSNSNLNIDTCNIDGSFLDTLETADSSEVDIGQLLAFQLLSNSTQSSFHNAAGDTEDGSSTGGFAQDRIEFFVLEQLPVDTVALNELGQLASGQNHINISITGALHLVTLALALLGGAGHDGYMIDAGGIDVVALSIPGLGHSTLHLLGALAGRQVGNEIGIVMLNKVDPTGRTGGDHGQNAAVLNTIDKLVAFLHDGQVSTEIGVEDSVKAQLAQSSDHLAGNKGAGLIAKALAQSGAHSGSCGNDNVLGGIVESVDDLGGLVLLLQSAGGAGNDALAAGNTCNVVELCIKGAADVGVETTIVCTDNRNKLILTGTYAAAAENALGVVTDEVRSTAIENGFSLGALKSSLILNIIFLTESLELAGLAAIAGQALSVVVGKDQFQSHSTAVDDLLGVSQDLTANVSDGIDAGSHQRTGALDFNNAHTAGADLVDVLEIAQRRNVDTNITSGLEDGEVLRHGILLAVNDYIYVFHFRHTPFLALNNGAELTGLDAGAALDALGGVDGMGFLDSTGDSANGALSCAGGTALALISNDAVVEQSLADAGGALLVNDMSYILIAEVTDGGKNGVGSSLTKAAQSVFLDICSQLFQLVQIFQSALALSDAVKDLIHTTGTDTAGSTLTAGLINGELEEELGDIDHAVVLVHDDETTGTDHGADLCKVIVVHGNVKVLSRNTSAGRTAGLSCLELLAVGNAAADLINDGAQRSTHGNLDEAGVLDLAAQSEDLGALCALVAHSGKPCSTLEDDLGDVGIGLNVVQNSGLAEQTLDSGERRTGTGLTAVALDGGHQSGFLTAYESTCTKAQIHIEIKAGAENILAQQTILTSLLDSDLQTMNGDGILSTDIYITLICTDSITGNGHSLDNSMGVTFQNRTVHECTGVTFVGVAADILLICIGNEVSGKLPLLTGGEAGAAAAAQTGIENDLDDLVRSHLGQNLTKSSIAVHSNILFDVLGIDNAAVTQGNTALGLIESSVIQRSASAVGSSLFLDLFGNIIVDQSLDDSTLEQMLGNDLRDILSGNFTIENTVGMNNDNGTESAQTEAAGLDDLYLFCKTMLFQFCSKGILNVLTARRGTAGASADEHLSTNHIDLPPIKPLLQAVVYSVFGDDVAADEMLFNNSLGALGVHLDVSNLVLAGDVDLDNGLILAHADAAGLGNGDLVAHVGGAYGLNKCGQNGSCTGGDAAGGHTYDDSGVIGIVTQGNLVLHLCLNGSKLC